jgi:uncharacterized membrane-anchored protein YitT (DUF2179 family)
MNKLRIKAILSGLLLLLFVYLAFSGALLYFGKTGVVMGIARHSLRETHAWTAFILCFLIISHLFLNRRIFLGEWKSLIKSKRKGREGGNGAK